MIDSRVCTDEGCKMAVGDCDLLHGDACKQVASRLQRSHKSFTQCPKIFLFKYHLACRSQFEIPMRGWFCDDECKTNRWENSFWAHRLIIEIVDTILLIVAKVATTGLSIQTTSVAESLCLRRRVPLNSTLFSSNKDTLAPTALDSDTVLT